MDSETPGLKSPALFLTVFFLLIVLLEAIRVRL